MASIYKKKKSPFWFIQYIDSDGSRKNKSTGLRYSDPGETSLSVQFARVCDRVGITGKSFHSLRHYKATSTFAKMDKDKLAKKLAENLSLEQIAALLGHANTKTTQGYLH